ncbi:hypothetical protein OBBRIDRAFT_103399 [Obba rivulosa]|uniref:Uncharacterized protein n=1 Tax=Obba rivulosa TaxID=1052685 RepID=A0A8E2DRU8_9APHY|nr:hypothetical protein OBBRIDRAFT_103399 [Obba rivulosa]
MGALRSCEYSSIIDYRDLQKVAPEVINRDIQLSIEAEFQKASNSGRFTLMEERPDAAHELAELADGLFIYSSTIVRYLVSHRNFAVDIYDKLLESQGSIGPPRLYERLNMLYCTILRNSFGEFDHDVVHMGHIRVVLTWLAIAYHPLSARRLRYAGIPTSVTMDVIDRLLSVLVVGEGITLDSCMKPCHASFPQFLLDETRCQEAAFLVEPSSGHHLIAASLLDFMVYYDLSVPLKEVPYELEEEEGYTEDEDIASKWMLDHGNAFWTDYTTRARCTEQLGQCIRTFT